MRRVRTVTTKLDHGDGFVSYEQVRPNGTRIVTLRLNGKSMGCLSNPQVSHEVAAKMLLSMARHDAPGKATPVDVTVSDEATAWNEQQLAE